ncbi:MAG: lamin tail domain-containing protein [Myxococcales bacterium]|nr:lamin tail domain-containing protein [Myxococcales bacterium]
MSIRTAALVGSFGCTLPLLLALLGACSSSEVGSDDMAAPIVDPPEDPPLPRVAVFNEIHYAPVDKTARQEFVEITSTSDAPLDLSNWRITGGISFTFPAGTMLAPGAFVVVAQDPSALSAKFSGATALGPYSGRLSSSGDTVILRDSQGRRRDEVAYGRGYPWPTGGGDTGFSMELQNPSLDTSQGGNWRLSSANSEQPPRSGPTPGTRNVQFVDNPPPLFGSVLHQPTTPRTGEPVLITAAISDRDGVADVTLEYQVVEPGAYVRLTDAAYGMGWVALPMHDDGIAGDVRAADGIYSVLLDGALSKHRRLLRYRITAKDGAGRSVRVPYADDPQPNFAAFVYDGVPAWQGTSRPGTTPVLNFGTDVMTRLPIYHLIASETDVTNSQYASGFESQHFWGTIVEGGTVYDHIEFENRGEFSTYVSGKNKWRFHFQRGHEFQGRDDFGRPRKARIRTMNLSACATPWVPPNRGMACLDESVAFRLYELAGVPSPHMNYLQFRVIDEAIETHPTDQYRGDLWGLYGTIEHTDGAFLDERDLPDGNVYKIEQAQGDKRNQGPLPPTTSADYDAFRTGFNAAQPITWWRSNMDLLGYYSFRSIDRIVNNMDLRDGWNHCQYRNPVTGLWTAMPWDLDMLYMPVTHWSGVLNLQNAILQHAELSVEYKNRGRELQDLLLTDDQLGALVDEQAYFVGKPAAGGTLSFAQLDEAMWNQHPRTAAAHRGAFYRNPASASFRGGTVNRTLVSADHAGMARWIKDFTLTGYGAMFLQTEVNDPAIPNRPTIRYAGTAGYPADGIAFRSGAFSDPQGDTTFSGLRIRVAEVTPSSLPPDGKTPRRYEIQSVWESPLVATVGDTIAVPMSALRVGAAHRARVRMMDNTGRFSRWSEPIEFTVGPPLSPPAQQTQLRITEIHYHPRSDKHEEFIEIMNIGDGRVDLSAVSITDGVRFEFAGSQVASLEPGQRAVVVENIDDFRARYGSDVLVAGEYRDRLSNGGERIVLTFGKNIAIQSFSYSDAWHLRSDGQGRSLELIDPRSAQSTWSTASAWRESAELGGSPGR